jgi:hypothetical protein
VLVRDGRVWYRRHLYNDSGTAAPRLCRLLRTPIPVHPIAAIFSLVALSGCSYQLASLVSNDENGPQVTGTIDPSGHGPSGISSKVSADVSPEPHRKPRRKPTLILLMRARPPPKRCRGAAGMPACLGKIRTAAPAVTSLRWRRPTPRPAWPAAISSPATSTAARRTGSKALPTEAPQAPGRSSGSSR